VPAAPAGSTDCRRRLRRRFAGRLKRVPWADRSASLRGEIVAFAVIEVVNDDACADDFEYQWLSADLRERAGKAYSLLIAHDGWHGREDGILMRKAYADFGVSVYAASWPYGSSSGTMALIETPIGAALVPAGQALARAGRRPLRCAFRRVRTPRSHVELRGHLSQSRPCTPSFI